MAVLYYAGVENVYYLNGGFDKWVDEKLPVQNGDFALKSSHFVIERNNPFVFVNENFVRWAVDNENKIQFVDARMYPEYTGQVSDENFGVAKLGHIKGAKNLFVGEYMQKNGIDPNKPMISYCHIGYWGSGLWFVANAILDNKLVWNYNGSLVKASRDKDIPFVYRNKSIKS
jgi:thiosulfate/3-mercaptopyruvate sulfurtransferase